MRSNPILGNTSSKNATERYIDQAQVTEETFNSLLLLVNAFGALNLAASAWRLKNGVDFALRGC